MLWLILLFSALLFIYLDIIIQNFNISHNMKIIDIMNRMNTKSFTWTRSALIIFFNILFRRSLKCDRHAGGLRQPRPVPICGFILWSCACNGAVLLMAEVLSDQEWLLAGWIPSQLFKKKHTHIHTAINRIWDKVHSHFTASKKSVYKIPIRGTSFVRKLGTVLAAIVQHGKMHYI